VEDVEDRIAALYALDPGDFVKARDELARALAEEGDQASATRVRGLKKPLVTVWVVNRLAALKKDEVRALVEQGDPHSGSELRAAATERRRLLNSLLSEGQKILEGAGKNASPAALQRVGRALEGAAQNDGPNLLAGTVAAESEVVATFGVAGEWAPPFPEEAPDRDLQELNEVAERAETEAREATEVALEAEAEARRLAEIAAEARARARSARDAAQRAARAR
jgi:hypothetical protein